MRGAAWRRQQSGGARIFTVRTCATPDPAEMYKSNNCIMNKISDYIQ